MKPSQKENELFLAALQQPSPRAQSDYLDGACGGDNILRARLETLLVEHLATASLQLRPIGPTRAGAGGTVVVLGDLEKPGDRIGRYKLLQQIGEGGCGIVYMAEQEVPVRRRVALKVIRLGMDTKNVVARFEAERQALAMMDHPNIAKVFDAGSTETGRPFFVMELVRGVKITDYCDQNQLSTEERLRLFTQVCQAIQHAHQKGVIHRDIKPSNILVTLHDGIPVPKVIDFGIAKAIEQRLTDKTLFTEFQSFIGTPAYTSPEQAEMSGLDVDTRSDIYGLGVLLYELLTGRTPFGAKELSEAGFDEMRRTIREVEPPRPSNCIATMLQSELTTAASQRQIEAPRLLHLLRGDLDWIVMKSIEKDRTRRYATASDLAADVMRYLSAEPVAARPPTVAYRIQKFVRRNKAVVGAGVVVTLVLVLGAIMSGWLAIRATRAEREQSSLRKTAENAQKEEAAARRRAQSERLVALRSSYDSDMNLVQQALAANNHGRAIDLLNQHRPVPGVPDSRQWEWRYYWNQSQSEAAFSLPSQPYPVISLAISPNGRFLVHADNRGGMKLWDLLRRTEVLTCISHHSLGVDA